MSKPTPGPWRVNGRWVMGLKNKTIAEVPEYGVIHGKVDAANARLIHAAPDLLKATRALVAKVEAMDNPMDQGVSSTDVCMDEARAAIAKATGATE